VTEVADLLGPGVVPDDLEQTNEPPPPDPDALRPCASPGCTEYLPAGAHWMRKYCDVHFVGPRQKTKGRKPPRDKKPSSIKVDFGQSRARSASAKDKELDQVEQRAKQLVQILGGVIALAAIQSQNEKLAADGADLSQGAPPWAQSVRELAEYEAWLRKLAAGGETSGRLTAWVGFAIATLGLLMPILLRHEALPGNLANLIEGVMVGAAQVAEPEPNDAAAQSAA
jgi:hypothetical protein